MKHPEATRAVVHPALLLSVLCLGACEDETNVLSGPERNAAPRIVLQGPDYGANGIEWQFPFAGPELFVLVADSNGLDDISAVLLSMDSIRVNATIVRPDTSTSSCASVGYVPSDTIDISNLIASKYAGFRNSFMDQVNGGLYASSPLFIPDFVSTSSDLGSSPKGCAFGGSWFTFFGIFPPAVPSPRVGFLTYADVQYFGVSAAVYDQAGASGTTTFPTLRVVYTTAEEKRTAP